MGRTAVLLGVLASLATWTAAQPLVDMCEEGSWTLGQVYISVSSTTMGDNSRCNCTLREKTPTQNTATDFFFWAKGSSTEDCATSHVTMVSWPPGPDGSGGGSQNFTCGSGGIILSPSQNTTDVYLTQLRSNPAAIFNYCLYVRPQQLAANNLELVCGGGTGASISSSTPATPTPSTSSLSSSSSAVVAPNGRAQTPYPSYSAAVVALAVVVWLLVLVLAVQVLLLCLRLRRKPTTSSGPGAENSDYASLPDITRSYPRADPNYYVIQSEGSSSQPGGGDASGSGGVYESVGEESSGPGRGNREREDNNVSGTYCNA